MYPFSQGPFECIETNLEIALAASFRFWEPATTDIHLQRMQDEPRHRQFPIALFAKLPERVFRLCLCQMDVFGALLSNGASRRNFYAQQGSNRAR